jgi:hypothetical protein
MMRIWSNRLKIIAGALPIQYTTSAKGKWWLADESIVPVAESLVRVAADVAGGVLPPETQVLQRNQHRAVLRAFFSGALSRSFVVKVFFLRSLKQRLKHLNPFYNGFGFGEAANLIIAAERKVKVPRVYGYGCVPGASGLPKLSIVLMEDLACHISLYKLLQQYQGDPEKCGEILQHTIPVFVSLYHACCNHIDVNVEAIILRADCPSEIFLVDFEFARFYNKPSFETLMFQASYLTKYSRGLLTDDIVMEWLNSLLDVLGVHDVSERRNVFSRFQYYNGQRLSRKQRMRIR